MEKYNEAYLKRKIASRKKLWELLEKYKCYVIDYEVGIESSRLIDSIDLVEDNLMLGISLLKAQQDGKTW